MLDKEKLKQALMEWLAAFLVLVGPIIAVLQTSASVAVENGEVVTVLPDLNFIVSVGVGVLGAAALAFIKAVAWLVTGTKIDKPQALTFEPIQVTGTGTVIGPAVDEVVDEAVDKALRRRAHGVSPQ